MANFKNTIIIMTSNLGSDIIQSEFVNLTEANKEMVLEKTETLLFERLKQSLRPEFLNRIDDIVMFQPLTDVTHPCHCKTATEAIGKHC